MSKYSGEVRARLTLLAVLDEAFEAGPDVVLRPVDERDPAEFSDEALEAVARKHGLYPPPEA